MALRTLRSYPPDVDITEGDDIDEGLSNQPDADDDDSKND